MTMELSKQILQPISSLTALTQLDIESQFN